MAEGDVELVIEEAQGDMERALRSLRSELQKVRTGRANPALLDDLRVDYYDTPTPLRQLASITVPDARLIVVSPFDQSALANIERAVQAADLGLTPNNDGKVVRIPIPQLTEERRREIVKQVRKTAEEHKIGVRDARRSALSLLRDLEGEGGLSSDDKRRAEKKIQDLTDQHITRVDEVLAAKEKEILEV